MEEITASQLLHDAEASVWKEAVTSEADVESASVSIFDLENGTAPMRFTEISVTLDPSGYVGYQILYCDFVLTANVDAQLVLEPLVRVGETGEARSQGRNTYNLTGGEATEISLSIAIAVQEASENVYLEIAFSSSLPFAPTEGAAEQEYVELASWAATTYEISGLRFYGAQTTAT